MVESGTSVDIPGRLSGSAYEIDLCEILDYVGRREGVSYVPNCALAPSSADGLLKQEKHLQDFPGSY